MYERFAVKASVYLLMYIKALGPWERPKLLTNTACRFYAVFWLPREGESVIIDIE